MSQPGLPRYLLAAAVAAASLLAGCGDGGGGEEQRFTVSGTVRIPAGTAVDGDVNDEFSFPVPNDSLDKAQPIPNPVTVGGYVNLAHQGDPGNSWADGDPRDLYRVLLAQGQRISLFFPESTLLNDLDLFLYNLAGEEVARSDRVASSVEEITVPAVGEYYIEVVAFGGASNYVLVVGQSLSSLGIATQAAAASKGAEFVPGELLVTFAADQPVPGGREVARATQAERMRALGLTPVRGGGGRAMLCRLEGDPAYSPLVAERIAERRAAGLAAGDPRALRRDATRWAAAALRARPEVASADLNYIRRAQVFPDTAPDDELYPQQWHFPLINLAPAWRLVPAQPAQPPIVAVVDTGVVLDHPDLAGQLVAGYDFISDPHNAADGSGIDPDPDDPGDGATPGSSSFHGTHVAGTVVALTDNATGVAGVAFNAKVMPVRVLGRDGGTDADIIEALRYAAGLDNASGSVPGRRADIVNLSLGGPGFSQAFQEAVNAVHDAGVTLVAAAGNEATANPSYPAAFAHVIAVSAVDINKRKALYSNFGAHIDVAAPGGNTQTDVNGDGRPDGVLSTAASDASGERVPNYIFLQGTSMATPHVSGVIALMLSVKPDLTPGQVDQLLASGTITEDLGAPGRDDNYGHGLIDALKAVRQAGGDTLPEPAPLLAVNPTSLNFGLVDAAVEVTAGNAGEGSLTGVDVQEPAEDWLTVQRPGTGDGLGVYRVQVLREGLAEGLYTATLHFVSAANAVDVPVIMQVVDPATTAIDAEGNAGLHFIGLYAPGATFPVDSIAVEAEDGRYDFDLNDVPAGQYELFAGTDLDNDGFICDGGEACAAYPTLDQPGTITVNGDLEGLEFVTGFAFAGSAAADASNGEAPAGNARAHDRGRR